MRQERAARTRDTLIRAAAAEFDRHGFAGASLSRISGAARISTGALTFHFATKSQLAGAVRQQGGSLTTRAVRRAAGGPEPAAQRMVALTLALVKLLEEEVVVRAAARLARESEEDGLGWQGFWMPQWRELLSGALAEGRLSTTLPADTAAALVAHLITGMEAGIRSHADDPAPPAVSAAQELELIWELVMVGIARR